MGQRTRRFLICIIALGTMSVSAPFARAETYLVPLVAQGLEGSDGSWWAQATVTNANAFPVTVRVVRTFPLRTIACLSCPAQPAPVTVAPHASVTLHPGAGEAGRQLVAGAAEVETTGPVSIHLVAYHPGANEIRQRLDVARAWLLPGTRAISTVERTAVGWRMNAFITNPAQSPLTVTVWAGNRDENAVRAVIAPGTTGVIGLPPPRCGGVPCPVGDVYPPPLLQVQVEADGEFLASVSSLGNHWAVFSLADEARSAP